MSLNRRKAPLALALSLVVLAVGAEAQSHVPPADARDREEPVQVLLLGVSHFAGSEGDDFTFAIEDILEDHRQDELDEAARRLADFAPEQSFLECMPERESSLNADYRRYLPGDLDPSAEGIRNEIQQLGFRVAAVSGHDRLGCVDAPGLWLGDQARLVGSRHQPRVVTELQRSGEASIRRNRSFVAEHDMVEYLRFLNTEAELFGNHSQYIERFVQLGTFEESEVRLHMESELEGREVVMAGDFGSFPVGRVRDALASAGVVLEERVSESTDYVVTGIEPGEAPERGRRSGARVMEVQDFVGYALGRSDLYVGFPDSHIGADLVGEWYKRNLRIFANILKEVEPETDRIFVMFGAGHVWSLRHFLRDHPEFEMVPVDPILR